jgi:hypothetical protein
MIGEFRSGHKLTSFLSSSPRYITLANRYAPRRSGNLPSYAPSQASYDVLGHPLQGDPNDLQEVYAECELYSFLFLCGGMLIWV